jgi:uncharacterized protein
MESARELSFKDVRIGPGFWGDRQGLVAEAVVPYQWKALNDEIPGAAPSHAVENLRIAAGLSSGEFHGFQFQDSDVAKWIEAASYAIAALAAAGRRDPELERAMDGAIELVGAAQQSDGYIQSYYSVAAKGKRWTDLEWGHELYCGGHLIEAAVAHFQATLSRKFLDIMLRYVDCVDAAFGIEEGKRRGYDGHPEIELALFKLYRVTRDERHLRLARYFVDERGRKPCYFDAERERLGTGKRHRMLELDYFQAQAPLREQRTAEGHAVRGAYLYCAMADYVREGCDPGLRGALSAIWENATGRRMYVTGAMGSQAYAERHSIDFDLPSDTAYAETCASIGLVMWAWRMLLVDPDSRYAEVLERALYNGVLSGMSADGKRFFYVNPLEVRPAVDRARQDHEHVRSRRFEWFGCACCPPNIARLVGSIGGYAYAFDEASVWVHNYVAGSASFPAGSGNLILAVETDYPWEGLVRIRVESGEGVERALRLRVPEWSLGPGRGFSLRLNGEIVPAPSMERGYAVLARAWRPGDLVELELDMRARLLYSRPELGEAIGLACVQRGPFILCAEEADNGPGLHRLELDPSSAIAVAREDYGFGPSLRAEIGGRRVILPPPGAPLYGTEPPAYEPCRVKLIPYFQWANRDDGEMRVWFRTM